VSKRTKDIGGRKGPDSETSYYSGLKRGIGDLQASSRGGNMEPAVSFSGETGQCICVVAKYID